MKPKVEINEKEREIITGEVKRSSCRGNEMLLPVLGLFLSWHLVTVGPLVPSLTDAFFSQENVWMEPKELT